ncbi:probable G-protein coupled receptor 141 isoform X1 [Struthio camelus]|uniref:probable G-protein coupled receptor 141 isoform X1 n=1 Tax=Struthio camelus TaxID=8801 RepID=UPI00360403BC
MPQDFEVKFREELYKKYKKCSKHMIPQEEYHATIAEIKKARQNPKSKSRHEYYLLTKYEILQCGDTEKLIKRRQTKEESPTYYVSIEDTYDIIKKAHIATGHGGRDRVIKHLSSSYANITRDAIELFKSFCAVCQKKKKHHMVNQFAGPSALNKEHLAWGQIDFISMQSMSVGSLKWIMVYQDYFTKFCVLRPLTSKKAAEVALQLLDIFLTFGAPVALQGHDGTEFITEVIQELKYLWPQLSLEAGKPRHSQSQQTVEHPNSNIKDMLMEWMVDNNSWDWTMGIRFVQFTKNSAYHSGIKCTPYAALFGTDPRCGLTSTSLPSGITNCLKTKEDLASVLTAPAVSPVSVAATAPDDHTGTAIGTEATTEPASESLTAEIRL